MSTLESLYKQKEAVERTMQYCETDINKLRENPAVKKYLENKRIYSIVSNELKRINTAILSEKVHSCSHILITDSKKAHYHEYECDDFEIVYCPKCGFTTDFDNLDENERNVMISEYSFPGEKPNYRLNFMCDNDLANVIKEGILSAYPSIDDETFYEYFRAALHNIATKKDPEKRSKHLALSNGFKVKIKK